MKTVRTISMGVLEGYGNRGTDLSLYYHICRNGVSRGYRAAEMSRVEEDNINIKNNVVKIGGKPYHKYQVSEYKL
jgi:hypothetical protein